MLADIQQRTWDAYVQSPTETVRLANELIYDSSQNSSLRELATRITERCRRVDLEGARCINRWVRRHIRYRRETPGTEVLQGPVTTLQTMVGDCDDLVILWASLCNSIGIRAFLLGVRKGDAEHFAHAMGWVPVGGAIHELTIDTNYGGTRPAEISYRFPPSCEGVGYDTQGETYFTVTSSAEDAEPATPASQQSVKRLRPVGSRNARAPIVAGLALVVFLMAVTR